MKEGRNVYFPTISSVIVVLIVVSFFLPFQAEARSKTLKATKQVKGISFDEFWTKAREEGTRLAGNRLRIRRIVSVPVQGFDGRGGLSPVWEAQMVRCDSTREQSAEEEESPVQSKTCKGKMITIRIVENGVSGADAGMHISKEIHFRGVAIKTERVTLSAGRAEEVANGYKQYRPTEIDNYTYELKYDHRNDRPIWVIKRTCGYKGKSEGRCTPGDHWIVKVNAESGDIIKQDPANKQKRTDE